MLERKLGATNVQQSDLPSLQEYGRIQLEPIFMLDRRVVKKNNKLVVQWLIHWSNSFPEDATCENASQIEQKFPEFQP